MPHHNTMITVRLIPRYTTSNLCCETPSLNNVPVKLFVRHLETHFLFLGDCRYNNQCFSACDWRGKPTCAPHFTRFNACISDSLRDAGCQLPSTNRTQNGDPY